MSKWKIIKVEDVSKKSIKRLEATLQNNGGDIRKLAVIKSGRSNYGCTYSVYVKKWSRPSILLSSGYTHVAKILEKMINKKYKTPAIWENKEFLALQKEFGKVPFGKYVFPRGGEAYIEIVWVKPNDLKKIKRLIKEKYEVIRKDTGLLDS